MTRKSADAQPPRLPGRPLPIVWFLSFRLQLHSVSERSVLMLVAFLVPHCVITTPCCNVFAGLDLARRTQNLIPSFLDPSGLCRRTELDLFISKSIAISWCRYSFCFSFYSNQVSNWFNSRSLRRVKKITSIFVPPHRTPPAVMIQSVALGLDSPLLPLHNMGSLDSQVFSLLSRFC